MSENYITITDEEWDCRVKDVDGSAIQEFYDWLQGKTEINRIYFDKSPKLSKKAAFSVIYYLQERLGIIEDNYEMCKKCGNIYDSYNEGDRHYCDNCRPD